MQKLQYSRFKCKHLVATTKINWLQPNFKKLSTILYSIQHITHMANIEYGLNLRFNLESGLV